MKKSVVVISLGGSLIIPEKMKVSVLERFKHVLRKHYKSYKFVVVCGGGALARKYISVMKSEKRSHRDVSLAGILTTRTNAEFMMQFFGKKEANDFLPKDMNEVRDDLKKNNVVFCGALRYTAKSTSDSTAAKLALKLKTPFINITNIKGLYTANPLTHKAAKFIPKISWNAFDARANKRKYKSGQHFVLDQKAATIVHRHKITTYIVGPDMRNLDRILSGRKFTGTLIKG